MRLLVFSPTRLFAECLAHAFAASEFVADAHIADSVAKAADLMQSGQIDAVLTDLSNPESWEQAGLLRKCCPDICILGLAVHDSADDVVECARLGLDGIIPLDAALADSVRIVRHALRGEVLCTPTAVAGLMRAVARAPRPAPPDGIDDLTPREREICGFVADGMTNKQIARCARCSEGTVKNHVHSILTKLNLPRRSAIGSRTGAFRASVAGMAATLRPVNPV